MGYSTNFDGELKFKKELTGSQLAHLKTFLGADRREIGFGEDNSPYESDDEYWYHIDLGLTDDFSGLKWNGAEKTYDLDCIINFITKQMRKKYKDFELIGDLTAQGEEFDDRWKLVMKNGVAKRVDVVIKGKKITCPYCEESFILEDSAE